MSIKTALSERHSDLMIFLLLLFQAKVFHFIYLNEINRPYVLFYSEHQW